MDYQTIKDEKKKLKTLRAEFRRGKIKEVTDTFAGLHQRAPLPTTLAAIGAGVILATPLVAWGTQKIDAQIKAHRAEKAIEKANEPALETPAEPDVVFDLYEAALQK